MSNFRRNGSGYYDPTAFQAIVNVEKERERRNMEIYRGDIFYLTGKSKDYGKSVYGDTDRPCIEVSNDKANTYSPVIEVVFVTSEDKKPLPTHVDVMCKIPSTALCEQVHSVNKSRLGTFIRSCSEKEMAAIDKALMISLDLGKTPDPTETVGNFQLDELNEEIQIKQKTIDGLMKELTEMANERDEANRLLQESEKRFEAEKGVCHMLQKEIEELKTAGSGNPSQIEFERDFYKQKFDELFNRMVG